MKPAADGSPSAAGVPRRLQGRVAVVTGASRGIGRAVVARLAAEGGAVVVNFLSGADEAQSVVSEVEAGGGCAIAVRGDVSCEADAEAIAEAARAAYGRIDILVNNAAIFPWKNWTEITVNEWDSVLAINLRGAFLMARACVPDMQQRGWGRVISMSSATQLTGSAFLMHYAASKAGIIGFTRSLARAVGDDGITVNAVSTGRTLTDGLCAWFDDGTLDYDETIESRKAQPIKRIGEPHDIVGTVAFLASDDASYMTGQLLNVDGGRNMY